MQSNNRPCSPTTARLLVGESVDDVTQISFRFFPTLLHNKALKRKTLAQLCYIFEERG